MSEVSSTISEQTLEENRHSQEIDDAKDFDLKIFELGKASRRYGNEIFDVCFDKENCLLNFPVYNECLKKLRKKCSLENNCSSCHSCVKCLYDWSSEIICECENCEKEKFPCEHLKFQCNCNLCKKIPDIVAIPEELHVFQRVVLGCKCNKSCCHNWIHMPTDLKVDFQPTHLRKSVYGASAIATHFAQERFSKNHYSDTWKEIIFDSGFRTRYIPDNGKKQEKAWNHHNEITKSIHEFRKKYHRFPPCFRERMDIRAMTKVSFIFSNCSFFKFSHYIEKI